MAFLLSSLDPADLAIACETKNNLLCGWIVKKLNSLAHTKWLCKYHIVFTPKYRRKNIYNQYRKDLQEYIKLLCRFKGGEIIGGQMMPDHVHLLVSIPLI